MPFQGVVAFVDPLQIGVVHRDFLLEDQQQIGVPRALRLLTIVSRLA